MTQMAETELQKALAAYQAQASTATAHEATIAEFRHRIEEIEAQIDNIKTLLATASRPPELDLALIREADAERRQAEIQLERLGQDKARLAAQMRGIERERQAMAPELQESERLCWRALFEQLKGAIDAKTLDTLFVAGLQAGLTESAVRAAILPSPTQPDALVAQLRQRFDLPD